MMEANSQLTVPADLVAAIFEGAFEQPLWKTFLDLIRKRTGADHATMIFRSPGRPLNEATHLYSGLLEVEGVRRTYSEHLPSLNLLNEQGLIEGRAYSFDELYPPVGTENESFYHEVIVPSGVNACRVVRVTEASGVSAWLTISRTGKDFSQNDSDILQSLAPLLRGSLRYYVALESERFTGKVVSHAMRSLYFSWITLDKSGVIIDFDPEVDKVFTRSRVISRSPDGLLRAASAKMDREIKSTIARLVDNPQSAPHAIILQHDPWLDMLLVRASASKLTAEPRAEVIAYVHGDSWGSAQRQTQLAELFGLTPSEARLTLVLSRGTSPVDAASELGLSIETVRSYIKVIYSKTGARGIADLVRIVMRSVLAFAPDR